ncbi:MAG: hypothetical protein ACT4P6_16205 [Gemmatimonadaceae bacterium]
MRSLHKTALIYTAALVAASCGSSDAPSDELLRDLSAAQSSSIELAARVQDYQPTRFVTAVEQLPVAAPTRARAPRRVHRPPTVAEIPLQETTPTPEPAQEILQTQVPEPEQQVVSAVPSVVPRPTATAATPAPTGEGRDEGPSRGEVLGTIIGETIGVVIRGGPVGPGHCPPRRRPGRIWLPLELPINR